MVPGAPQLEVCDEAVMNWAPAGCKVRRLVGLSGLNIEMFFTGAGFMPTCAQIQTIQMLLATLTEQTFVTIIFH